MTGAQAEATAEVRTLGVLLTQAERARDAALAEHHRAQVAARAAADQSQQLLVYRREYEARWHAQFRHQGQMDLVRCYHQFMDKLTIAVEHQARVATQASMQTERSLERLRELELRCASVAKLIERRLAEVRLKTDRREQKQADEHAMRAAWARNRDESAAR